MHSCKHSTSRRGDCKSCLRRHYRVVLLAAVVFFVLWYGDAGMLLVGICIPGASHASAVTMSAMLYTYLMVPLVWVCAHVLLV